MNDNVLLAELHQDLDSNARDSLLAALLVVILILIGLWCWSQQVSA